MCKAQHKAEAAKFLALDTFNLPLKEQSTGHLTCVLIWTRIGPPAAE